MPDVKCMKCKNATKEPRYFPCGHLMCNKCTVAWSNEHIQRGGKRQFPCYTCEQIVPIPEGGIKALPKEKPDGSFHGASTMPTLHSEMYEREEPVMYRSVSYEPELSLRSSELSLDPEPAEVQDRSAKLVWQEDNTAHIWDVAFLEDGTIVYLKSTMKDQVCRRVLNRVNLKGQPLGMQPPVFFHDPFGISVQDAVHSIAVSDYNVAINEASILILKEVGGEWECATHNLDQIVERLNLMPSGEIVCTEGNEMLIKLNAKGKILWRNALPSGNNCPYIACDQEGHIIVSTPNNYKVSVYNSDGSPYVTFPERFLKEPTGVCTDSSGRVLVADSINKTVSLFRMHGNFIKQILKTDADIRSIALYKDKYLVLGTPRNGLFLYELQW